MSDHGIEINNVFKYARQFLYQVNGMLNDIDSLMEPDWEPAHDDVTELSTDFGSPESWLIKNVVRIYEGKDKNIYKGVTFLLWGDEIEEPVIVAGKIETEEEEPDYWTLYYSYINSGIEPDRKTHEFFEQDKKITIFAFPLTEIENNTELTEKIIVPLSNL